MAGFQILGHSARFRALLNGAKTVAAVDCSVLLQSGIGTGTKVFARAIDDASSRRHHWFATNCAAIPAALLESELLGHERHAFTGAIAQSIGRFQIAHRGALFLDEIGELPIELQPKLLCVFREQQFE